MPNYIGQTMSSTHVETHVTLRGRAGARKGRLSAFALAIAACATALGGSGACGGDNPLVFTNVRVEEITAAHAVVRFTTSRPATCVVRLGTAADALDQTFTDPNMEPGRLSTDHNVPLENLTPSTPYYFRAEATDASGSTFLSSPGEFSTLANSGPTLTNVALLSAGTTVVTVSSNWGGGANDSTYGVNKALDADFTTEWSTSGDGDGAFVELDLGQRRMVVAFGFRSRQMSDGSSIITSVGLSLDGGPLLGPFDTSDPTQLYVFTLAAPVEVQRARVSAATSSGGNTGAKEIQLLTE